MEGKSASRTAKRSGGAAVSDRKKSKPKKKRDRRKASVKGTESTDVPSPEVDSEALQDGTDQDGQTTPAGQVTRLPHLSSQSSVSLTTQTPPPAAAVSAPSRKSLLGVQQSSSSAPPTRTTAPASMLVSAASANNLDGVVARVANLNIKQRSSRSRSKAQAAAAKSSGKSSRARDKNNNNNNSGANARSSSNSTKTVGQTNATATVNESLRWEWVLDDVEQERARIAIYKMNRRKRYLAAAQAKGLGWAMNYNSQTNASPLSEDSGVETVFEPSALTPTTATTTAAESATTVGGSGAYIDFSTVQTLRPIPPTRPVPPAHRGLQEAFVEC